MYIKTSAVGEPMAKSQQPKATPTYLVGVLLLECARYGISYKKSVADRAWMLI